MAREPTAACQIMSQYANARIAKTIFAPLGAKPSLPGNCKAAIAIVTRQLTKPISLPGHPLANISLSPKAVYKPTLNAKIGNEPAVSIHFEYEIKDCRSMTRQLAEEICNHVLDELSEALVRKYHNFEMNIALVYAFTGAAPFFHLDVFLKPDKPFASVPG